MKAVCERENTRDSDRVWVVTHTATKTLTRRALTLASTALLSLVWLGGCDAEEPLDTKDELATAKKDWKREHGRTHEGRSRDEAPVRANG